MQDRSDLTPTARRAAVSFAAVVALAGLVGACLATGCTPAERQLGAELGVDLGEAACLVAAHCSGIVGASTKYQR